MDSLKDPGQITIFDSIPYLESGNKNFHLFWGVGVVVKGNDTQRMHLYYSCKSNYKSLIIEMRRFDFSQTVTLSKLCKLCFSSLCWMGQGVSLGFVPIDLPDSPRGYGISNPRHAFQGSLKCRRGCWGSNCRMII